MSYNQKYKNKLDTMNDRVDIVNLRASKINNFRSSKASTENFTKGIENKSINLPKSNKNKKTVKFVTETDNDEENDEDEMV